MRIKAVLCAAAVAALATSAVAQNVFSLNVVGYVNTSVPASASGSFTMIANPLNTTNNTIGALLTAATDGTLVYKYTGTGFAIATFAFGIWDHPEFTLNPGEGAIVFAPSAFTQTFVGEVMQGNLTNAFPAGFSIRASQVPQAGTLTQLSLPITSFTDGDLIYKLNPATQGYDIFTLAFGTWTPSEPSLAVGESLWLSAQNAGSWNRNFTVGP